MYCVCLRNNGTTWNATCSVTVTVVSIVRSLIEVLFEIHYIGDEDNGFFHDGCKTGSTPTSPF